MGQPPNWQQPGPYGQHPYPGQPVRPAFTAQPVPYPLPGQAPYPPPGQPAHLPPHPPRADPPVIARVLYFLGAGITLVYIVASGYITQAIFGSPSSTASSTALLTSLVSLLEHLVTTALMLAGVFLVRSAPMGRRLIAAGIVVLLPVATFIMNLIQGVALSAFGFSPTGAAFITALVATSGLLMLVHALCLLTAWNVVCARPASAHIIAACGAVVITFLRAIVQIVAFGAAGITAILLLWVSFLIAFVGLAALFFISWNRRAAAR